MNKPIITRREGGTIEQDFQDDLNMWGGSSAEVSLHDENGNRVTDFVLTPEEVLVMLTALRNHYAALGA